MIPILNSLTLITVGSIIFILFIKLFIINEKPLFYLISAAFLAHLILISVIFFNITSYYYPLSTISPFFNDGEVFSSNAWLISKTLKEQIPEKDFFYQTPGIEYVSHSTFDYAKKLQIPPLDEYEVGYITYIYGVIYAAYGYVPVFINFINIVLHLFAGILVFKIGELVFDKITGYIATIFFIFNPVLFYYSTTKLKESIYIFVALSLLYSLILSVKKKWYYFLPIIPLFLIIVALKPMFFSPLVVTILAYFFFLLINKKKSLLIIIIPSFIVTAIRQKTFLIETIELILREGLYRNFAFHKSLGKVYALLPWGNNFVLEYPSYSLPQILFTIPKAWYHMLFEPIVSANLSMNFIMFIPIKIVFLCLCLFAIFGILISLREKNRETILFLSFLFCFGSIIALGSGNIGTMLRHRDIITPIIFIYSAYCISKCIPDFKDRSRLYPGNEIMQ